MRAKLKRLWDRYRHFRAAQGLAQDILTFLGWKKTLVALVTGSFTFASARVSHLAAVEQFVLALGAFAFVLIILNSVHVGQQGIRLHWPQFHLGRAGTPWLEFEIWHAGSHRGYPTRVNNGAPSWVAIRNSSQNIPKSAKNTRVEVEWMNDAQTTRLPVPEAAWYVMKRPPDGHNTDSWKTQVDLEGGESQSFVLFVTDDDGRIWIRKASGVPVGILDDGHWEARLTVTSDTGQGFEGTLGFTLSQYKGLTPDSPAFAMRRRVRPKLP